jgi:hypothetical protein
VPLLLLLQRSAACVPPITSLLQGRLLLLLLLLPHVIQLLALLLAWRPDLAACSFHLLPCLLLLVPLLVQLQLPVNCGVGIPSCPCHCPPDAPLLKQKILLLLLLLLEPSRPWFRPLRVKQQL